MSGEWNEYIREFLASDKFNVGTKPDKAVLLSDLEPSFEDLRKAFPNVRLQKDQVTYENTPGARALGNIYQTARLSPEEARGHTDEARLRFIAQASGNLTVLVGHGERLSTLLREEIPRALQNDKILSINHIEARQFRLALDADPDPSKALTHQRVLDVLSGRESVAHLLSQGSGLKPSINEDAALDRAIGRVGGRALEQALNRVAGSRYSYYQAMDKVWQHDVSLSVMGWRRAVQPVRLYKWAQREVLKSRHKATERECKRADREISLVRAALKEPGAQRTILEEAARLAGPGNDLGRVDRRTLEQKIDLHIHQKITEKSPELNAAVERIAHSLQQRKGRGL